MLSNQDVLNGVRAYFIKRMNNYGGFTHPGWGDAKNTEMRCALGSLVGDCSESKNLFCPVINVFYSAYGYDKPKKGFLSAIWQFNDRHCSDLAEGGKLTRANVNQFLSELAKKWDLTYSPIHHMELKETSAKVTKKWLTHYPCASIPEESNV